jgi:hypothetical protein
MKFLRNSGFDSNKAVEAVNERLFDNSTAASGARRSVMVRTVRIGDAEVPDKSGESPGSAIWHQLLWRQSKADWQYYCQRALSLAQKMLPVRKAKKTRSRKRRWWDR